MNRFRDIQEHPQLKDGDDPSDFWGKYYSKKGDYLMRYGSCEFSLVMRFSNYIGSGEVDSPGLKCGL